MGQQPLSNDFQGLVGIPVSNRQGQNGQNYQQKKDPKEPRTVKQKLSKEEKLKADNDYKQSLEGLSIVGMGHKGKKWW